MQDAEPVEGFRVLRLALEHGLIKPRRLVQLPRPVECNGGSQHFSHGEGRVSAVNRCIFERSSSDFIHHNAFAVPEGMRLRLDLSEIPSRVCRQCPRFAPEM